MSFNYEEMLQGEPLWHSKLNRNFKELKNFIDDTMRSRVSPANITVKGRTLVNLLGRDGNPAYQRQWVKYSSTHPDITFENGKINFQLYSEKYYGGYINKNLKPETYYVIIGNFSDDNVDTHGKYRPVTIDSSVSHTSGYIDIDWTYGVSLYAFKSEATQKNPEQNTVIIGTPYSTMNTDDVADLKIWNIRLYEITKEEYEAITNMPATDVDKMYPYVDDIKGVVNPYFESVENLIDNNTFYQGGYGFENSPEEWWLPIFGDEFGHVCNQIPVILEPGTYTLSGEFNGDNVIVYGHIGVRGEVALNTSVKETFTVEERTVFTSVVADNNTSGVTSESAKEILAKLRSGEYRVTLVRGSEPKLYDECNNSRIMFETTLHDGETIKRQNDGTYVKSKLWEEVTLIDLFDKSTTVGVNKPSSEFTTGNLKYIRFVGLNMPETTSEDMCKVVGYDGTIHNSLVSNYNNNPVWNEFGYNTDNGDFRIAVPNRMSGWGEDYNPTTDEIRAFLLGWVMYDNSEEAVCKLYNRTDGLYKAWVKIWCGNGEKSQNRLEVVDVIATSSETVCPNEMNNQGYIPYRVLYTSENPTTEKVNVYGSLLVNEDIDVFANSGLVLNENARISYGSTTLHTGGWQTQFKHKCEMILDIIDNKSRKVPFEAFKSTDSKQLALYGKRYAILAYRDNNPMNLVEGSKSLYIDYTIYEADTVRTFDYRIEKASDILESLENIGNELSNCYRAIGYMNSQLEVARLELAERINPNLLINPDFKINQRGKSTYSTAGYSVDRWFTSYSEALNVVDDGVQFVSTINNTTNRIEQRIENYKALKGKTLTFSVNVSNNDGGHIGLYYDCGFGWTEIVIGNSVSGVISDSFKVPTNASKLTVMIQGAGIRNFTIGWAKLEIGSVATPFVNPDPATELVKCQRYCQVYGRTNDSNSKIINFINAEIRDGYVMSVFNLPVQMRTIAQVTDLSAIHVRNIDEIGNMTGDTKITLHKATLTSIIVLIENAAIVSKNQYQVATVNIGKLLVIDSEIY